MRIKDGKLYLRNSKECLFLYDYLLFGIILSCMLNLMDASKFFIWQFGLIFVFTLIFGINKSLNQFLIFVKENSFLVLTFVSWIAIHTMKGVSSVLVFRTFSFLFIIWAGYLFAGKVGENGVLVSLKRMMAVLLCMIVLGILWYLTDDNPLASLSDLATSYLKRTSRLTSFWLHPIPAACFIGIFLLCSSLCVKTLLRNTFFILAATALLMTQTRSAWAAIIVMFIIANRKRLCRVFSKKVKRKNFITGLLTSCIVVGGYSAKR